jgi:thymidylate kinase
MPRGLFVTFEGLDGSGKSTQLRRLKEWLLEAGHPVTTTRQPGGTRVGDRIRALLLDTRTESLAPLAELGLMFSDRAQAIAEVIEPALRFGSTAGRTTIVREALSRNISRKGPRNCRSLAFPGFPVESCGFGRLRVVLFEENRIRGRR